MDQSNKKKIHTDCFDDKFADHLVVIPSIRIEMKIYLHIIKKRQHKHFIHIFAILLILGTPIQRLSCQMTMNDVYSQTAFGIVIVDVIIIKRGEITKQSVGHQRMRKSLILNTTIKSISV